MDVELEEGVKVGGRQSLGRAGLCATGRCSDVVPLDFSNCQCRRVSCAAGGPRPGPRPGCVFLPVGGS